MNLTTTSGISPRRVREGQAQVDGCVRDVRRDLTLHAEWYPRLHGSTGFGGSSHGKVSMLEKVWPSLSITLRDELVAQCVAHLKTEPSSYESFAQFVARVLNSRAVTMKSQWQTGRLTSARNAITRDPERAAVFLIPTFIATRSSDLRGLYLGLGVPCDNSDVGSAARDVIAPTESRFTAVLHGGVPDVEPEVIRCMVAIIADGGIESWRKPAADALARYIRDAAVLAAATEPAATTKAAPVVDPEAPSPKIDPPIAPAVSQPRIDPPETETSQQEIPESPVSADVVDESDSVANRSANPVLPGGELSAILHTPLDRLVISMIVGAANDRRNNPDLAEAEQIVEELLALDDRREQSWYDRGFLDALQDGKTSERLAGENKTRHAWYLAGFLTGCRRMDTAAEFVTRIRSLTVADIESLKTESQPTFAARAAIGQLVVATALEVDELDLAISWMDAEITPTGAFAMLNWLENQIDHDAPERLLNAMAALQARFSTFSDMARGTGEEIAHPTQYEAFARATVATTRLQGTALRLSGRFEEASRVLESLPRESMPKNVRAAISGGLALAKLGVAKVEQFDETSASLVSIGERVPTVMDLLDEGDCGSDSYAPSLLLAALPYALSKQQDSAGHKRARDLLARAIELTSHAGSPWADTRLPIVAGGLHAVVVLEAINDDHSAAASAAKLCASLNRGLALPHDTLNNALIAAVLSGATEAIALLHHLIKRVGPHHLQGATITELVSKSPELGAIVMNEAEHSAHAGTLGDPEWSNLSVAVLKGFERAHLRDEQTIVTCVDGLELRASRDTKVCQQLLDLIANIEQVSFAWDEEERDMLRVQIYMAHNRSSEALEALTRIGNRAVTGEQLSLAEDCAELLEELDGAKAAGSAIRERILRKTPVARRILSGKLRAPRIAFIGGDETQDRYDTQLEEWFREHWSPGKLEIRHTGWGANWLTPVDDVLKRLNEYDAVVLLSLVRTNLGRRVRKRANDVGIRWVPCTGHGIQSIKRAIESGVHASAKRRATARQVNA